MMNILKKYSDHRYEDHWFNHAFEDVFYHNFFEGHSEKIEELPNYYQLDIPVPGLSRHDISIHLEGDVLVVEGKRDKTSKKLHGESIRQISYRRSMYLPSEADQDKIKASVKNGMLYIKIYKKQAFSGRRKISIQESENRVFPENNYWWQKMAQSLKSIFRK